MTGYRLGARIIEALQPVSDAQGREAYDIALGVIAKYVGLRNPRLVHHGIVVECLGTFEPWQDDLIALEVWEGDGITVFLIRVDQRERIYRDVHGWRLSAKPWPPVNVSIFSGRLKDRGIVQRIMRHFASKPEPL
jgi:hypothetical protein